MMRDMYINSGEILGTKYYHCFIIETEFFVASKNAAGGLRGCCEPPNGGLIGQSSLEKFNIKQNIKWITLEKFQTVINQQV